MDWSKLSKDCRMSEFFMREYKDQLNWDVVSRYQKLSEPFIREMKSYVNWKAISIHQKLSEMFMIEFENSISWNLVSRYQMLSEKFIRSFHKKLNMSVIGNSQRVSLDFLNEFGLLCPEHSWLHASDDSKLEFIKQETDYEIFRNYVSAYKTTRNDGWSTRNWQYKYEIGRTYEAQCDCDLFHRDSFGLSAWTKEGALSFYRGGKLFEVEIDVHDIGAVITPRNKLRCFKFKVVNEIESPRIQLWLHDLGITMASDEECKTELEDPVEVY